jgi:hypothetical protein
MSMSDDFLETKALPNRSEIPAIEPGKLADLWRPSTQSDKPAILLAQSTGLPTLRDWLGSGLGSPNSLPRQNQMNERDRWECARMSQRECDNYQRLSPRDRDYRNSLPHNDRYDFDRQYLRR